MVVGALLFSSETVVSAEESFYKMRMHKNFIKNLMDKNFPVVLNHIQSKVEKNVFLTQINANIDNLSLQIRPQDNNAWDKQLDTELFFDQGQIVMEIAGLEYHGVGRITDPQTGQQEDIELRATLDLCQMVISLEQELTEEGFIYPHIEISDVAFTLHPDMFVVDARGDLPLYRSH